MSVGRSTKRIKQVRWTGLGRPMEGDVNAGVGCAGLRPLRQVLPAARSVDDVWGYS